MGYHGSVFASLEEPALHERLRSLTLWPVGAFVLVQVYFSAIPFLPGVPRWLFESMRLVLLAGVAGGLAGGLALVVRRRRELGLHAAVWLAALAAGILVCGWTFARMTFPSFA